MLVLTYFYIRLIQDKQNELKGERDEEECIELEQAYEDLVVEVYSLQ